MDIKRPLKIIRYRFRRARAALRWGAENLRAMPAVLGNAMPKSGSHLLTQILHGLTDIGPFVDPGFPPVNRSEDNRRLSNERTLAEIRAMRPGDIRYGYLHAREPFLSTLTAAGRATLFLYRDPRDWIISQIFYATDMHTGHMLHEYYRSLPDMEARINVAIEGVNAPGVRAPSVVERYRRYMGWLEVPGVLCLRFEDLIGDRRSAIGRILDYLEALGFRSSIPREEAISLLAAGIAPHKSGTFRKGQPGEWRRYFSAANKARFDAAAGDLVRWLGYEEA